MTPSPKPDFDGRNVKKGATISCGAYHDMQEINPVLLIRADKIYFDSQKAVLSESGDILNPLEKGEITKEVLLVILESFCWAILQEEKMMKKLLCLKR